MRTTHIGPRIVFVICCVAALSALSLSVPQARAQERAEFDAFFDTVTRAERELFRGRAEPLKALGPARPTSRSLASPAGAVTMVGTRSDDDSTGRVRSTQRGP